MMAPFYELLKTLSSWLISKGIKKNDGTKKFLLKWGINPRFFRKYYLKGDKKKEHIGPLDEPKISTTMFSEISEPRPKIHFLDC